MFLRYIILPLVCLAMSFISCGQTKTSFSENECVSEAWQTCVKILREAGFKNVLEEQSNGYGFLIKTNYAVNSKKELFNVLKNNQTQVQELINKVNLHAQTPVMDKNLLSEEFPKAFFFRKPDHVNTPYSTWSAEYERLEGIFVKALAEELANRKQEKILQFANRFAIEHPNQLTVLHFNGRARDPNWEGISKYSAGHWVYNKGCYLAKDLSESDSLIFVTDETVFETKIGIRGASKKDDIVIVPLDDAGNKLWEKAEQVKLVSKAPGKIKVERGQYETIARTFKKGKAYIAPHAVGGPWGNPEDNNLLWYYNLSSTCPKDKNGYQCADILSSEITSWFEKDGIAFAFDGIQFDIASWKMNKFSQGKRFVDIDNDGVVDRGFVDGRNVYGEGSYRFYKLLRDKLGENKLIIGDGGVDYGMRAVGLANGMEAEGLCDWSDAYREYSKPLSFFKYWDKYGVSPSLSYVTNKIKTGTAKKKKEIERMVLGTAQCLGIGFNTFIPSTAPKGYKNGVLDELVKGVENKRRWLGKPIGELIDFSEQPDLLKPLNIQNIQIKAKGCDFKIENDKIIVSNKTNKANNRMKLVLKNVHLGTGDLHLKFSAKSSKPIEGFVPIVPRQVVVKSDSLVDTSSTASSVINYINSIEFLPCSFYFRNVLKEYGDLEIEIEGGAEVVLKNFKLVNAPMALAREFENGVVLVNPSLQPYRFNLSELFPDVKFKRLMATEGQDELYNNGQPVGESVTLNGLNGLFLIKENNI